ncbi:hypothetical protein VTK73DRAFT_7935 [Phialemonium thermophilum]|uniref:Uncharacterized protein n=1 Tax=Phialemonium thermophilum TaxID=223376 RepID=A0ABR3WBT0_9PEZI
MSALCFLRRSYRTNGNPASMRKTGNTQTLKSNQRAWQPFGNEDPTVEADFPTAGVCLDRRNWGGATPLVTVERARSATAA